MTETDACIVIEQEAEKISSIPSFTVNGFVFRTDEDVADFSWADHFDKPDFRVAVREGLKALYT